MGSYGWRASLVPSLVRSRFARSTYTRSVPVGDAPPEVAPMAMPYLAIQAGWLNRSHTLLRMPPKGEAVTEGDLCGK